MGSAQPGVKDVHKTTAEVCLGYLEASLDHIAAGRGRPGVSRELLGLSWVAFSEFPQCGLEHLGRLILCCTQEH